jgi:hypothetical protein
MKYMVHEVYIFKVVTATAKGSFGKPTNEPAIEYQRADKDVASVPYLIHTSHASTFFVLLNCWTIFVKWFRHLVRMRGISYIYSNTSSYGSYFLCAWRIWQCM